MTTKQDGQDTHETDIKEIRELDMKIALDIAGFAGMPTRDRHGNVMGEIWTKTNETESAAAKLLDYNDMRSMLKDQLRTHLEARKELLLEVDSHDVVAKWIFDFSEAWEKEYRNRSNNGWDIAQVIQTAMQEALYEVREILEWADVLTFEHVEKQIADIIEQNANTTNGRPNVFADAHRATIRFYFRNTFIGPIMTHIAGKKLQKQIVCNRSGAYAARVQRNDVQQEVDNAVDQLYFAVENDDPMFDKCQNLLTRMQTESTELKWILDHTTFQRVVT